VRNGRRHGVVHRNALEQHAVVGQDAEDMVQALRQRGTARCVRLEYADVVSGRGQQIADTVAHQAAADHADFLLWLLLHRDPRCRAVELAAASHVVQMKAKVICKVMVCKVMVCKILASSSASSLPDRWPI